MTEPRARESPDREPGRARESPERPESPEVYIKKIV
jgi:hypothetical protein